MQIVRPRPGTVVLVVVMGMVAISTGAIFARWAMQAAGRSDVGFGLWLAAGRVSLAAIAVAPAWRSVPTWPRSAWPWAVGAGACLAVHFVCWLASLGYTSIAASTVLVTTTPIWVALAQAIERRRWIDGPTLGGLAVTVLGSSLISGLWGTTGSSGSAPLLGNGLALAGAVAAAAYLLLGRSAQQRGLSIGSYAALVYGVAALLLGPVAVVWGGSWSGDWVQTWGAIALSALVPQLIGHTSFNWLVAHTSPLLVTLAILFEPVGASTLGWVIFGERPGPLLLFGGGIVLVGVAIVAIAHRERAN